MNNDKKINNHPSIGAITVSRTQVGGKGMRLVGSDLDHNQVVRITLHHAREERNYGNTQFYHTNKSIVDFYMSEYAWARFVSSFGNGMGTEVTLSSIKDEPNIPPVPKSIVNEEVHKQEQREELQETLSTLKECLSLIETSKKDKKFTMKVLDSIEASITKISRTFRSTIPMLEKDFDELMETKMAKAKVEFEAFYKNTIIQRGLEAIADDSQKHTSGFHELGASVTTKKQEEVKKKEQ